jgi:hypothetical protein
VDLTPAPRRSTPGARAGTARLGLGRSLVIAQTGASVALMLDAQLRSRSAVWRAGELQTLMLEYLAPTASLTAKFPVADNFALSTEHVHDFYGRGASNLSTSTLSGQS